MCQEVGVAGSVVVTNPASSPGLLDDQVNSLMETQQVREGGVLCHHDVMYNPSSPKLGIEYIGLDKAC